ncbi:MAG: VOC family protein [Caulobacteraceae bacterium]
MNLNHLHLHVADADRAEAFYGRWFGLRRSAQHGEILFMRDGAGLDLALAAGEPDRMPAWFHFGFRLESKEEVAELHSAMVEAEVPILADLIREDDMWAFRCADPDGHPIEIYWEDESAL